MDGGEEQRLAEMMALEPLSDEKFERLFQLRTIASGESIVMDRCPECGVELAELDIAAHADRHWPPNTPAALMSPEAKKLRAALQRAASKQRLPRPEPETEEV